MPQAGTMVYNRGCFAIWLYNELDFDDTRIYKMENQIVTHLRA